MSSETDLLTTREVALLHRVTTTTVRRWVHAGHLPAVRLPGGRTLRFRRSDVERLLDGPEREAS